MLSQKISDHGTRFSFRPRQAWDLYCYLIEGRQHNFLIDTACGSDDAILMRDFITKNCAPLPLVVINTHHDWDHIWGNFVFCKNQIIASQKCVENINANWNKEILDNAQYISGEAILCLPNHAISDTLNFFDDDVEIFLSNGHTDDGLCVYDKRDKILYVGDNIGDNDTEVVPSLRCSKEEYRAEVEKLKKYDFLLLASGHNRLQPPDFLEKILQKL